MPLDFITSEQFTAIESFAAAQSAVVDAARAAERVPATRGPGSRRASTIRSGCSAGSGSSVSSWARTAGTPLTVRVVTRTVGVDRWAAGDDGPCASSTATEQDLLEPWVEREPVRPAGAGRGSVRAPTRAARCLRRSRTPAMDAHRDGGRRQLPARSRPGPPSRRRTRRARPGLGAPGPPAPWAGVADGEHIAAAIERPPAVCRPGSRRSTTTSERRCSACSTPGSAWYRAEVSPAAGRDDAWIGERLEYRFRVGVGRTACSTRRRTAAATSTGTPSMPHPVTVSRRAAPAPRGSQPRGPRAAGQPAALRGHAGRPVVGDGGRAGQRRPRRGRAVGPGPAPGGRVRPDLRQRLARRAGRRRRSAPITSSSR